MSKFQSGFHLQNESFLFSEFLKESPFAISGFSYGGILAFKEVLNSKERIDTLQLFSPAFFGDKKFARVQLFNFKRDRKAYLEKFLKNGDIPEEVEKREAKLEELEELLLYNWSVDEVQQVVDRGVEIEIYLGTKDKIVNWKRVRDFFMPFANVIILKGRGHSLVSL
jgi:hypothetical protein